jgi:hypothetical protein
MGPPFCSPFGSKAGALTASTACLAGGRCTSKGQPSNRNPLDLIERYLIAGAVIELGCAGFRAPP